MQITDAGERKMRDEGKVASGRLREKGGQRGGRRDSEEGTRGDESEVIKGKGGRSEGEDRREVRR